MNAMEKARREMFGITNDFTVLENAVFDADSDTGEINEALIAVFDEIQLSAEEAVLGAANVYRSAKSELELYRQEEKRISQMREKLEQRIDVFCNAVEKFCKRMGVEKIEGINGQVGFKKNPPSVKIDNEAEIPEEFFRTKIEKSIDKTAIKKAIQSGQEVAGAHLEQDKKFYIK